MTKLKINYTGERPDGGPLLPCESELVTAFRVWLGRVEKTLEQSRPYFRGTATATVEREETAEAI